MRWEAPVELAGDPLFELDHHAPRVANALDYQSWPQTFDVTENGRLVWNLGFNVGRRIPHTCYRVKRWQPPRTYGTQQRSPLFGITH